MSCFTAMPSAHGKLHSHLALPRSEVHYIGVARRHAVLTRTGVLASLTPRAGTMMVAVTAAMVINHNYYGYYAGYGYYENNGYYYGCQPEGLLIMMIVGDYY